MNEKFLAIQSFYNLIDIEPFVLLGFLLLLAWLFYKVFLKNVSLERHKNIYKHFADLARTFILLAAFFGVFLVLHANQDQLSSMHRVLPYVALVTFVWGNIFFVKACRLIVLMYMFLGSMQAGVPLLLVNIFSLLLSAVLIFWGATHIFNIQVGPLIATSAAFSIVLGLAMQDTLGNLFAGISLQLDKNFEIGDWVEVVNGIQKGTGQVKELSWRSTVLIGLSDEVITIPNRIMAQAQISNYSPRETPIIRSQVFKLRLGTPLELAKETLEKSIIEIPEIRTLPPPLAYLHEITENGYTMKLIYYIDAFGSQFSIGDKVFQAATKALQENRIELARQTIEVLKV